MFRSLLLSVYPGLGSEESLLKYRSSLLQRSQQTDSSFILQNSRCEETPWPEDHLCLKPHLLGQEEELDVRMVIQRLFPVGEPGLQGFNPLDPRAADMDLDEKGKAKTLHLIISRLFVPLVRKGESSRAVLWQAVEEVLGLLQKNSVALAQLGSVFSSAVADVEGACRALEALVNPLCREPSKHMAELTGAKRGPLFLLRQTITTSSVYKELLSEIERTAVAEASFAPLVVDLEAKVESGSAEAMSESLEKLSLFRKSLRQGATQRLEMAISKKLVEELGRSKADGSSDKLEELVQAGMRASQQLEGEPRQQLNKVISQSHQVMQHKRTEEMIAAFQAAAEKFGVNKEGMADDDNETPGPEGWCELVDCLSALRGANLCKEPAIQPAAKAVVHTCMSKMETLIEQAPDNDLLERARDVLELVAADVCEDAKIVCMEGTMWMVLAKLAAAKEVVKTEGGPQAFVNSDSDRKKSKALLDCYVACRKLEADGVNESVLAFHQKLLREAKQTLQDVAQAEVSGLKNGLLQEVRSFEPSLLNWKDGLDKSAPWKTVLETAEKTLLAPGVGVLLQQHWKSFCKACLPQRKILSCSGPIPRASATLPTS